MTLLCQIIILSLAPLKTWMILGEHRNKIFFFFFTKCAVVCNYCTLTIRAWHSWMPARFGCFLFIILPSWSHFVVRSRHQLELDYNAYLKRVLCLHPAFPALQVSLGNARWRYEPVGRLWGINENRSAQSRLASFLVFPFSSLYWWMEAAAAGVEDVNARLAG